MQEKGLPFHMSFGLAEQCSTSHAQLTSAAQADVEHVEASAPPPLQSLPAVPPTKSATIPDGIDDKPSEMATRATPSANEKATRTREKVTGPLYATYPVQSKRVSRRRAKGAE